MTTMATKADYGATQSRRTAGQQRIETSSRLGMLARVGILVAGLALSYLGSQAVFKIAGLYAPEPALLAVFAYLFLTALDFRRAMVEYIAKSGILLVLLSVTIVTSIALVRPEFSLVSFYTGWRALVAFLLAFSLLSYFYRRSERFSNALILLCLSASFFSFVNQYLNLGNIDSDKNPFPTVAALVGLVIAQRSDKVLLASVFLGFLAFSSLFAFLRQNLVIFAIAALYYSMFLGKVAIFSGVPQKRLLVLIMVSLVAFLGSVFAVSILQDYLQFISSNQSWYTQVVRKWYDFHQAISTGVLVGSERGRVLQYAYYLSNIDYYILPNGLVPDDIVNFTSLWGGGAYNSVASSPLRDSVVLYFLVVFGLFITLPVAAWYLVCLGTNFIKSTGVFAKSEFFLLFTIMAITVMLDGTSLTQIEKAPFTGLALALLVVSPRRRPGAQIGGSGSGTWREYDGAEKSI